MQCIRVNPFTLIWVKKTLSIAAWFFAASSPSAYAIFGVTSQSAPQAGASYARAERANDPASSQTPAWGQVGALGYGYLSPGILKTGRVQSVFFGSGSDQGKWKTGIDYTYSVQGIVSTQGQFREASFWWEAPEMAVGYKGFWLGRKTQTWSMTDDFWGMGLWQPRNRWDYLQVSPVGLMGAFAEIQTEDRFFSMTAYFSPIYVPERGPTVALREGLFYPSNPWPGSPPASIPLSSRDAAIVYQIQMPPLHQLLLNPGGALQMKVQSSTGFWSSLSYAYKPINQVQLGYEGILNLATYNADASIYPRVAYHHLATLEAGLRRNQISIWSTLTAEKPMDQKTPSWLTTPKLVPSTLFSSTARVPLSGSVGRKSAIEVSYLKRFGDRGGDIGPWATPGQSVFEPRFLFQNAVALGYRGYVPGFSENRVSSQIRWVESLSQPGSLLSAELAFRPTERFTWTLGTDLMGASSGSTDPSQALAEDFMKRYQAYDRVYGGISYAL
ncbi:MAG: hypothetical protein JNL01_01150 [Bdellovibrionales bacterium]|nr:hypothetical protein [Bdellovibrionales bacterium]